MIFRSDNGFEIPYDGCVKSHFKLKSKDKKPEK